MPYRDGITMLTRFSDKTKVWKCLHSDPWLNNLVKKKPLLMHMYYFFIYQVNKPNRKQTV